MEDCDQMYEFSCGNGFCIDRISACDGIDDCGDSSDESQSYCSTRSCNVDEFRCDAGRCIPNDYQCDGEFDCADETDEQYCSKSKFRHTSQ